MLEWIDELAAKDNRAFQTCRTVIDRLASQGHELRRPTTDLLQDGIYELRARVGRVNYRFLYFFHGRSIALLAHGLTNEAAIPKSDLKRALDRRVRFESNPEAHTYREND